MVSGMAFPIPPILAVPSGCCPICGAPLPCYGSGIAWPDAEALAHTNRPEALRRIKAHTGHAVREAGPGGITQAGIAVALGLDPRGIDDVERFTVSPRRIN